MVEHTTPKPETLWDTAWSWVIRQHEWSEFDSAAQAELAAWLAADPDHKLVYDKACRIWLLAGLVPPATDIDAPQGD